ncbi:MAG: DTW domain-containing protein [Chromatiales bacterium]|jgi:DTW domain-containing protein YfiP|nr:DTW domain-containing protein [Chromatiales bacterium]
MAEPTPPAGTDAAPEDCPSCRKPVAACICDRAETLPTKLRVIVLQHPQENDALLGTAPLLTLMLPKAEVRVGLSWPSLAGALGVTSIDRSRWAVLAVAKVPEALAERAAREAVLLYDPNGRARKLSSPGLDGILVLDGSWSQAKTLWWRNPWLLKLPRLHLNPVEPSMYGRLRKEPRREAVSTLEAVADVLPALGEPPATRTVLRRVLRTFLQRVRDAGLAG